MRMEEAELEKIRELGRIEKASRECMAILVFPDASQRTIRLPFQTVKNLCPGRRLQLPAGEVIVCDAVFQQGDEDTWVVPVEVQMSSNGAWS